MSTPPTAAPRESVIPRVIVVGVDGSPASLDGLLWAVGEAHASGAQVQAVIAWGDFGANTGYALAAGIDLRADARSTIDHALRALGDDAGKVSATVVEGRAADVLLSAAEGADLLVVGSRGHGEVAGMLLGSVSENVVTHAHCPVVVMPHAPHV